MKKNVLPEYIWFLLAIFMAGMALSTGFRLIFLFHNLHLTENVLLKSVLYALFNRGLLFDANINSIIIALPFLIFSICYIAGFKSSRLTGPAKIYLAALYTVLVAISAVDIPFFSFYNSRISRAIFSWVDTAGLMFKVVFATPAYYQYIALLLGGSLLCGLFVNYACKRLFTSSGEANDGLIKRIGIFLIFAPVVFLGIRGEWKIHAKPLEVENAFFSKHAFLNQLALNPPYTFFESFQNFRLDRFDDETAIRNAQEYFNIAGSPEYDSPIARRIRHDGRPRRMNVVIVLVESLSAVKMRRYGNSKNLMPCLEKIADNSLVFDNFYTSGRHTYNGLFSTLFSFPTLMKNKPMQSANAASQTFAGLPNVLKSYGYQTIFICGGDKNFDNMDAFFAINDFEVMVGRTNYPKDAPSGLWGVCDHVMFDYTAARLESLAEGGKPFLAVLLTVSSHKWNRIVPVQGFEPKFTSQDDIIYEYADWAIGRFMEEASKQDWFDNTVFVFLADHGQNFSPVYELPLAYHHSPLLIYAPAILKPKKYDSLAVQLDIFPTLMGILRIPYVNNTVGVDLRREERPFAYFTADDKLGCLDDEYYLIMKKSGEKSLYKYREKDLRDYSSQQQALVQSMERYVYSMLQTTQWMLDHHKVSLIQDP